MTLARMGVVIASAVVGCLVATDSAEGSCVAETTRTLALEEVTVAGEPASVSGGASVAVQFRHGPSITLLLFEADAPEPPTELHLGLVEGLDGGTGE